MDSFPRFEWFNVAFPSQFEGIAHVEINRADKLNAFHEAMWKEYDQIFSLLSSEPSTRAVVLTGAGDRAFTAGLDLLQNTVLGQQDELDPGRKAWGFRRHIEEFQDCIGRSEKCEKPVICVLHGISFGLAIDIACTVDIRLCTADAKFAIKEVDIGLAADIGTLSRLPKVVGSLSWVKDVCLTARIFGADEALRQGLVSAVYKDKQEAVAEAFKLAVLLASKSPIAVQSTKALLNYSVDHTIQEGLRFTQVWNASALQVKDVPVAIEATLKKKKPVFAKL